ncbi:MAG: outer membrane protein assembly factor BamB, partial [Psychromonas sp.]
MNKWFKRFAVISSSVFVLTGCSLFSSEEDVVEMAELPVFEATYQPQIAWEKGIGSGVDKYYSQLKPALDYENVYVASREGKIQAYDVTEGTFI